MPFWGMMITPSVGVSSLVSVGCIIAPPLQPQLEQPVLQPHVEQPLSQPH